MFNDKRMYPDDILIRRVWDVIEIKNVMALRMHYHAFNQHARELDEIWVKCPINRATASYGINTGYIYGFDAIAKSYGNCGDGVGKSISAGITTPYIEVAADGQTAQGLWYAQGSYADGGEAMFTYERYGVDFIKEDDEWKIWHLFQGTDFTVKPGEDLMEYDCPLVTDEKLAAGLPTDGALEVRSVLGFPVPAEGEGFVPVKDAYNMNYNYCHYPPIPKPYDTFKNTVSYGLEGHPKCHPNFVKEGLV